jgi:hypothetical protein
MEQIGEIVLYDEKFILDAVMEGSSVGNDVSMEI